MDREKLLSSLKEKKFPENILKAFEEIRREKYIPEEYGKFAYDDTALPIGYGQTISQPQTVAFMLELLELDNRIRKILEVGSGSGYALSLLSLIAPKSRIFGTEIIPELYERSKKMNADRKNVEVRHTPGILGLEEEAPFERILVSASAEKIPAELTAQLADPGIIVCPVKNSILKIRKTDGRLLADEYPGFSFVKLVK